MSHADQLGALGDRLDGLIADRERVPGVARRVQARVLRALGWVPRLRSESLDSLLCAMDSGRVDDAALGAALAELSRNLAAVERLRILEGRLPGRFLRWLWRVHSMLRRIDSLRDAPPASELQARLLAASARLHTGRSWRAFEAPALDRVETLVAAAVDERESLSRRRRLLEGARELLLDTQVAHTLAHGQTAGLADSIGTELSRIARLESMGVSPAIALGYQFREALRRQEVERAHGIAVELLRTAGDRGDGEMARRVAASLGRLWDGQAADAAAKASALRSGGEFLGNGFVADVDAALQRARAATAEPAPNEGRVLRFIRERHHRLVGPGALNHLLRASLAVDARFELGGPVSPRRIGRRMTAVRVVPEPTDKMVLTQARRIEDLPNVVPQDPRSLLHDLAAGRLLTRAYERRSEHIEEHVGLVSEVRVYCVDGSGSMHGPRAYMRDSILLSELRCLQARLEDPDRHMQPVLFYQYFSDALGPVRRVDELSAVREAIADVIETPRGGGTDIQSALEGCFKLISDAAGGDRELARAQIVLITDGEAPVDGRAVWKRRATLAGIPIGLSVIALGEENPTLRDLAAAQRARGERVFYHFLSDAQLAAMTAGVGLGAMPLHAPQDVSKTALLVELTELADELEAIEGRRQSGAMVQVGDYRHALRELGLHPDDVLSEGERARHEVLLRDRRALEQRFEHWFPPPVALEPGAADAADGNSPARMADDAPALRALHEALEGVAEVVALVAGEPLDDMGDAIELAERLSLDAGIGPWRYDELLRRYPAKFAPVLTRIRRTVAAPPAAGAAPAAGRRSVPSA